MSTKFIMTTSAVFLAALGIALTFFPREIAEASGISTSKPFQVILQLLGALYFSFAMLNWMAKGAFIGGIYNRPIAVANCTHFFMGALVLFKASVSGSFVQNAIAIVVCYLTFATWFGLILFRSPGESK